MFDFIYQTLLRRHQYLIKKDFQFRYIGLLIGLCSAIFLILVVSTKYFINLNLDSLLESGLLTSPMATQLVVLEKAFLNKNLFTIFWVMMGTITLAGIFITHRIAGPIFSLERRMKQIAQQGIASSDFRIRRTDEFQELAGAFNEMIMAIQKQTEKKSQKLDQIRNTLSAVISELEKSQIEKKKIQPLYDAQKQLGPVGIDEEYKKAA